MAIRKIVKYGDPILRQKLKPVDFEQIAPELPALLQDMEETCQAVHGVGLAANQIGLDMRLALILLPESDQKDAPLKRIVLINPEFVEKNGEVIEEEGCLSLLGGPRPCKRYQTVKVRWQNEQFQTRIKTFTGWTAQIIQHEIDHCNGILI